MEIQYSATLWKAIGLLLLVSHGLADPVAETTTEEILVEGFQVQDALIRDNSVIFSAVNK